MHRFFYLLISLMAFPLIINAQGMEFFEGSWEEALQKSKDEGKPIFVDAYAEWCGPCKRMARDVFPDNRAGDYFNERFINMQIDMEKGQGPELARKFQVRAYPTLIFVSHDGEEFHRHTGALDVSRLIQLGAEAFGKFDINAMYRGSYEEGDREFSTVYGYMLSLRKNNESTIKVANDFLKTDPQLTDKQRQEFVFAAASEADSKMFDEAISYKKELIKEFGQEEYEKSMMQAVMNTVKKAIEFQYEPLMTEAVGKIKKFSDKNNKKLKSQALMYYYGTTKNNKSYLKAVDDYYSETKKEELKNQLGLVRQMITYFNDKGTIDRAIEIVDASWSSKDNSDDLLNAAQFYVQCRKDDTAKSILKELKKKDKEIENNKHFIVLDKRLNG